MSQASERLAHVQILRGMAALLVVAFHAYVTEHVVSPHDGWAPGFLEYGRFGVDLFFVISGFIMVHVTRNTKSGASSAGHFFLRRCIRIYPPYWIVTAGVFAVWAASNGAFFDGVVGERPNWLASLLLAPHEREPALGVAWTLIHEMYFYLIFALIIAFCDPRHRLIAVLGWAGVTCVVHLAGLAPRDPLGALVFHPLNLLFAAGAIVGAMRIKLNAMVARWCLAVGAIWLGVGMLTLGATPSPDVFANCWARVLLFGAPATLIVMAAAAAPLPSPRSILAQVGVALGDWSYAIYLVHVPVMAIFAALWVRLFDFGQVDNVMALLGMIAASILVGAFFYRWVEQVLLAAAHRRAHTPAH